MQVRDLERLVFERFPRQLAESWDRPGLSVGDPTEEVACIACALDPTPTNVRAAASLGANVLLTHHPAFLDPPFPMTPEARTSSQGGAAAYEAARLGVSLIAMHTNLDRSELEHLLTERVISRVIQSSYRLFFTGRCRREQPHLPAEEVF